MIRRKVSRVAFALACIALGGCELQRAQNARDAKAAMRGMSKEAVLRCMGPPENAATVGSTEVWSYTSGNGRTDTAISVSGWAGQRFASGIGSGVSISRFCKVDVVMQSGRVARVNYSGPTGGLLTEGEQCAFAIENCLHPAGRP